MKSIFQLRVGLSLLRSHKKRHNCKSAPENINHYLFHCNLFQVQRLKLINSVAVIVSSYNLIDEIHNEEIYLCGHRSLSCEGNRKIILCTMKYIKVTGRFD